MAGVHPPRLIFYVEQNTRAGHVRVNQVGTISCKNQTGALHSSDFNNQLTKNLLLKHSVTTIIANL